MNRILRTKLSRSDATRPARARQSPADRLSDAQAVVAAFGFAPHELREAMKCEFSDRDADVAWIRHHAPFPPPPRGAARPNDAVDAVAYGLGKDLGSRGTVLVGCRRCGREFRTGDNLISVRPVAWCHDCSRVVPVTLGGWRNNSATSMPGGKEDPSAPDANRTHGLRFRKPTVPTHNTRLFTIKPTVRDAPGCPNSARHAVADVTVPLQSVAFSWFFLGAFCGAIGVIFTVWAAGLVRDWGWL